MTRAVRFLFGGRFWALALKELRQIRRDRRLTISLIVPPVLQVLLFGFALDSDVRNLQLGIVDESRTPESRELVAVLTQNRTFQLAGSYATPSILGEELGAGRLDIGVVVPYDFARRRMRGRPATVQVLLNAANANTAQIAQGYVEGAVASLNRGLLGTRPPPVELHTAFMYNPGLVNAWYIVTGVFGTLIILNGSLVAAATMIREKERGTVEQLLMTPASALEVVTAKLVPLFILLMAMVGLVLVMAAVVFGVPFRGNGLLVLAACALLRADRDRAGDVRLHARPLGQSDAAHQLLHQSAAGHAVGRADADRGHAEVGPAAHALQPHRPLRQDRPQRAAEGRRPRRRLPEPARPARAGHPLRGLQRLAVPQPAEAGRPKRSPRSAFTEPCRSAPESARRGGS